eukprot:364417-Chlamydomonas_euryale.AAC.13
MGRGFRLHSHGPGLVLHVTRPMHALWPTRQKARKHPPRHPSPHACALPAGEVADSDRSVRCLRRGVAAAATVGGAARRGAAPREGRGGRHRCCPDCVRVALWGSTDRSPILASVTARHAPLSLLSPLRRPPRALAATSSDQHEARSNQHESRPTCVRVRAMRRLRAGGADRRGVTTRAVISGPALRADRTANRGGRSIYSCPAAGGVGFERVPCDQSAQSRRQRAFRAADHAVRMWRSRNARWTNRRGGGARVALRRAVRADRTREKALRMQADAARCGRAQPADPARRGLGTKKGRSEEGFAPQEVEITPCLGRAVAEQSGHRSARRGILARLCDWAWRPAAAAPGNLAGTAPGAGALRLRPRPPR